MNRVSRYGLSLTGYTKMTLLCLLRVYFVFLVLTITTKGTKDNTKLHKGL